MAKPEIPFTVELALAHLERRKTNGNFWMYKWTEERGYQVKWNAAPVFFHDVEGEDRSRRIGILTLDQYRQVLASNKGKCAFCGKDSDCVYVEGDLYEDGIPTEVYPRRCKPCCTQCKLDRPHELVFSRTVEVEDG